MAFTGGRDGSIFMTKLVEQQYHKVYQAAAMITSLKYDPENHVLWVGTPSSSIVSLDLTEFTKKP